MKKFNLILLILLLTLFAGCSRNNTGVNNADITPEKAPQETVEDPVQSILSLSDELSSLERDIMLDDSTELLSRFEELEKKLIEGQTEYSVFDLYFFYDAYLRELHRAGLESDTREKVNNYISLCEGYYLNKDITKLDVSDAAYMDKLASMYVALLVYGTDYDDLIINAINKFAEYCSEYIEKADPENDYSYETNSIIYTTQNAFANMYSLLLQKDYEGLLDYVIQNSEKVYLGVEMYVYVYLKDGDAENAASIENEILLLMEQYGIEADAFSFRLLFSNLYAYEMRGIMPRDTILEYLNLILLKGNICVSNVTGSAREAGLKKGDIITKVNNEDVYCSDRLLEILDASVQSEIIVLRDGETLSFTLQKNTNNRYGISVEYEITR